MIVLQGKLDVSFAKLGNCLPHTFFGLISGYEIKLQAVSNVIVLLFLNKDIQPHVGIALHHFPRIDSLVKSRHSGENRSPLGL